MVMDVACQQLEPHKRVPTSWDPQAPEHNLSPFLNSYNTTVPTNQARMQQQQTQHPQPVPPIGSGNNPNSSEVANSMEIDKKSESLRQFSGNPTDFIDWSCHLIDHMSKVHICRRYTLEWISKTDENLSMNRLRTDWLGPY